jgi:hypothetical protein
MEADAATECAMGSCSNRRAASSEACVTKATATTHAGAVEAG